VAAAAAVVVADVPQALTYSACLKCVVNTSDFCLGCTQFETCLGYQVWHNFNLRFLRGGDMTKTVEDLNCRNFTFK
jgi:hypothetical protein